MSINRPEDVISASILTRHADTATNLTAATASAALTPPSGVSYAKAVRLYHAADDLLVEIADNEAPDDPVAGSLLIPAGTVEWLPVPPSPQIKLKSTAGGNVYITWLS